MVAPSQPPPELVARRDGWLPGGRILDVGCGLGTETGYLAARLAAGIDLSGTALAQAAAGHQEAAFLRADVRHALTLPGPRRAPASYHYAPSRWPRPPRCSIVVVSRAVRDAAAGAGRHHGHHPSRQPDAHAGRAAPMPYSGGPYCGR